MAALLFRLCAVLTVGSFVVPASAVRSDSGPGAPAAGATVWGLRGYPLSLPCRLPHPDKLQELTKDYAAKAHRSDDSAQRSNGNNYNIGLLDDDDEDNDDDFYNANPNDDDDYKNTEDVELFPDGDVYDDFDGDFNPSTRKKLDARDYNDWRVAESKPAPSVRSADTPGHTPPHKSHNVTLTYTWYHNGTAIPAKDNKKTVLQNGTLYIKKLGNKRNARNGLHDTGIYYCVVNGTNGVILSTPVVLKYASMASDFERYPFEIDSHKGDSFQLGCHIRSNPPANITWERDEKELPKSIRYTIFPSGSFLISGTQADDSGSYRCRATNAIANKTYFSRAAIIKISPSPFPSIPVEFVEEKGAAGGSSIVNVTATFGEELLLSCALRGSPKPKVVWDFLPATTGSLVSQVSSMEVLRISSPDARTAGMYTCSVKNEGMVLQKSYHVKVTQPEHLLIGPTSVSVPTPKTVRLNCSMGGEPAPTVIWYKDGKKLIVSGRVKFRPPELIITDTVSSDAGVYQCMSSSGLTSAWAVLCLTLRSSVIPPQNPRCFPRGPDSITMTWHTPPHYKVMVYTVHSAVEGGQEKSVISKETNFLSTALTPYTPYKFYVKSYIQKGVSDPSSFVVCQGQGVPVEITTLSNTSISVSWKDTAKNVTNIKLWKIEWREYGSKNRHIQSNNITLNGNATNFIIDSDKPIDKYEVRVLATTSKEWIEQDLTHIPWTRYISKVNAWISPETKSHHDKKKEKYDDEIDEIDEHMHPNRRGPVEVTESISHDIPTDVQAMVLSPYSANLSWRCDFAEQSSETYIFNVCYGKIPQEIPEDTANYVIDEKCSESIGISIVIPGLDPDSLYYFKVQTKAHNHKRPPSPFSEPVTFRTKHDAATSVTDVRWTALEGDKIKISWQPSVKSKSSENEQAVYQIFYSQDPTAPLASWSSKNVTNATEVELTMPDVESKLFIIVSIWGEDRGPVVVIPPRSSFQSDTITDPPYLYAVLIGVAVAIVVLSICAGVIVWQKKSGRTCLKCRKAHPARNANATLDATTGNPRSNCVSRSDMECQELMVTPGYLDLKTETRNTSRAWGGSRDNSRGPKIAGKGLKGVGEPLLNGHVNITDNPTFISRCANGDIRCNRTPINDGTLDMSRYEEPPDVTLETILEADSTFGSSTAMDLRPADDCDDPVHDKVTVHREMTDSNMNSEGALKESVLGVDLRSDKERNDLYPNLNYDFRERAASAGPELVPSG